MGRKSYSDNTDEDWRKVTSSVRQILSNGCISTQTAISATFGFLPTLRAWPDGPDPRPAYGAPSPGAVVSAAPVE